MYRLPDYDLRPLVARLLPALLVVFGLLAAYHSHAQITNPFYRTFEILTPNDSMKANPVRAITEYAAGAGNIYAGLASGWAVSLTDSTFYHYLSADSLIAPNTRDDMRDMAFDPTDGNVWRQREPGCCLSAAQIGYSIPTAAWCLITSGGCCRIPWAAFILQSTASGPDCSGSILPQRSASTR